MTSPKILMVANATHPYTPDRPVRVRGGFTMIEMLIVVALISITLALTLSFTSSSLFRAHAENERDLIVALLLTARSRALANSGEAAHGVFIDTARTRYVIYEKRGGCTRATTSSIELPLESGVAWSGPLDRCFSQLSARVPTLHTGTTSLALNTETFSVQVNTIGRIDW